jgi:hypothetical protein
VREATFGWTDEAALEALADKLIIRLCDLAIPQSLLPLRTALAAWLRDTAGDPILGEPTSLNVADDTGPWGPLREVRLAGSAH